MNGALSQAFRFSCRPRIRVLLSVCTLSFLSHKVLIIAPSLSVFRQIQRSQKHVVDKAKNFGFEMVELAFEDERIDLTPVTDLLKNNAAALSKLNGSVVLSSVTGRERDLEFALEVARLNFDTLVQVQQIKYQHGSSVVIQMLSLWMGDPVIVTLFLNKAESFVQIH